LSICQKFHKNKFLRELYLIIIIYLQVMGMPSCGQEVNATVAVDILM